MTRLRNQGISLGQWEFEPIRQLADSPGSRTIFGLAHAQQRPPLRAILKVFKWGESAKRIYETTLFAQQFRSNPPAVLWYSNDHAMLGSAVLSEYIDGRPLRLRAFLLPSEVGREMAQIHSDIHAAHVPAQGSFNLISSSRCLCAQCGEVTLVHNDLHPSNIIESNSVMRVIDWSESGIGCPAADVANSLLLLDLAVARSRLLHVLMRGRLRRFVSSYVHTYIALSGMPMEKLATHYHTQFPKFRHNAMENAYSGLGAASMREELGLHARLRPVAGQHTFGEFEKL